MCDWASESVEKMEVTQHRLELNMICQLQVQGEYQQVPADPHCKQSELAWSITQNMRLGKWKSWNNGGNTVQIRIEHNLTTMHTGSRKRERSRQSKKWKCMENMTAATSPIHKPQIQAKLQIIRTVILKADRRARVSHFIETCDCRLICETL